MTPAQRRYLRELHRQQDALEELLAATDDEMATAWVRAWDSINRDLRAALAALAEEGADAAPSLVIRGKKGRRALQLATVGVRDALDAAGVAATSRAREVLAQAEADLVAALEYLAPAGAGNNVVTPNLLRVDERALSVIVERTTEQVTSLLWELEPAATAAMKRALVRGLAGGEHPDVVARRMLKEARGAFNGGLARATTIARTELLDAHRAASDLAYRANADALDGWVWVAEPGACFLCYGMAGSVHDLSEPGPWDHPNGRCSRAPLLTSWRKLGYRGGSEPPRIPTGDEQLRALPEAEQREVLGSRFDDWKNGTSVADMVRMRANPGWRPSVHPAG